MSTALEPSFLLSCHIAEYEIYLAWDQLGLTACEVKSGIQMRHSL